MISLVAGSIFFESIIKRWLWIIKCFELERSARKIASQVQLSYPTVLKAVTLIISAIISRGSDTPDLLKGKIEPDETYFGGRRKGKRGRGAYNKARYSGSLKEMALLRWSHQGSHDRNPA